MKSRLLALAMLITLLVVSNRKLNDAPTAGNLPASLLWTQIHKEYPALNPMMTKPKWKVEFAI